MCVFLRFRIFGDLVQQQQEALISSFLFKNKIQEKILVSHLFYLPEGSINEVSCFCRIPVSLVVFNHTGNKHVQFLPFTKERLMGSWKEIHYPWKEIIELMEKTKESWRQVFVVI